MPRVLLVLTNEPGDAEVTARDGAEAVTHPAESLADAVGVLAGYLTPEETLAAARVLARGLSPEGAADLAMDLYRLSRGEGRAA